MTLVDGKVLTATTDEAATAEATAEGLQIPIEAALVMSAMEAGRPEQGGEGAQTQPDRRGGRRRTYRVAASVWLFSDPHSAPATIIYTRDASRRGVGFITNTPLPLGHGGIIELAAPDGTILNLHFTLLRCRRSVQNWYEGNLHFNRDQPEFDWE